MIAQARSTAVPETAADVFAHRLRERIGPHRFEMWFATSVSIRVDSHRVEIDAESHFVADWIETRFRDELLAVARQQLGSDAEVAIHASALALDEGGGASADARSTACGPDRAAVALQPNAAPRRSPGPDGPPRHSVRFRRLDDFVVGTSNHIAYASACRLADPAALGASPLFIHGGCGLGKTHLLQGICHRYSGLSGRRAAVRYITGEQFTNQYIASIRNHTIDAFRQRIRKLELLAIDDVHFLANKTATQAEFLHTIDAIDLGGARLVLASDEHPRDIRRFSQGLISRFLSGIVVRVDEPDRVLRIELLRRLATARGLALTDGAIERLAAECSGSVRELEGAVTTLAAMRALTGEAGDNGEVGTALTERFLGERQQRPSAPVHMPMVLSAVCRRLSVDTAELLGTGRHRRVVLARGATAYLARELTTLSYPEIAMALGRTNHSTIHSAAQRFRRQLDGNEWIDFGGADRLPLRAVVDDLRSDIVKSARLGREGAALAAGRRPNARAGARP